MAEKGLNLEFLNKAMDNALRKKSIINREQRLWQLYCIFVRNGMFAPDALEKANAFLEHFEKNVKREPLTSDDLELNW